MSDEHLAYKRPESSCAWPEIAIGDHFGMTPMQVVAHFERERLLRSGSVEWFRSNGGITKDHVAEARADRALADTGAIPDPSLEVQPK